MATVTELGAVVVCIIVVWLALSVLLALGIGRAVQIRDRRAARALRQHRAHRRRTVARQRIRQ